MEEKKASETLLSSTWCGDGKYYNKKLSFHSPGELFLNICTWVYCSLNNFRFKINSLFPSENHAHFQYSFSLISSEFSS